MATTRTTETVTFDEETLRQRREQFRQREQARRLKYPSAWHDPQYYSDPRNNSPATYLLNAAAQSPYPELTWNRQSLAASASTLGPEAEQMLMDYTDRGIVSPEMASGLVDVAKVLQLPEDTINAISTLDNTLKTANGEGAPEPTVTDSEAEKSGLNRFFSSATRPLFSMLSMPMELVQGNIREMVGNIAEADGAADVVGAVGEFVNPLKLGPLDPSQWEQTLGGQTIRGLVDPNYAADLGDGWFPGGDVMVRAQNAKAEAAPLIHGEHWSLGRAAADLMVEDPDSREYRGWSGLIDMVASIAMDPLVLTGVGAAGSRTAQAGERIAGATEQAVTARAAAAEEALRTPEAWLAPRETVQAATEHVRAATKEWADTTAQRGWDRAAERLATATDRSDDVGDRLVLANDDVATPTTPLTSDEVASRVQSATENIGNEALGAFSARIAGQAPPVKGVVTDATPAQGSSLIGSVDGVDSVVTINKPNPRTVSTDDMFEPDELIATIGSLPGPKSAKTKAVDTVKRVRDDDELANTFEHLVDAAARSNSSATLGAALRHQDIDGVTDLFRLTEGEGGVWWVTRDVDVVTRQADGTWAHAATDAASLQNRVDELGAARRSATAQKSKATQDANQMRIMSEQHAAEFSRIMDGVTDLADDTPTAVRSAVDYAMGVRHKLGGKPQVDHDAVKSFFFGTRAEGDEAVGAMASTKQKTIRAADRAMIAGATFGFSEAARAAGRAFQPLLARARQRIFDDLVTLDDTPVNLGRLHRLTNGKIDGRVLQQALRATNENEVLEALAPHMGVKVNRPITPNAMNLARMRQTNVSTGRRTGTLFQRGMRFMIDEAERMGTIAPRGLVSLNFADPLGSARDLRNYLDNVPNVGTHVTDEIMGTYLQATTETGRARAVMQGFDRVYETLSARTASRQGWDDEVVESLNKALKDATQVYDGGRAEVNTWWSRRHAIDGVSPHIVVDGQNMPLPGPQLEAELARGGVVLPSARNIRRAIGRYGAFIQEGKIPGVALKSTKARTGVDRSGDVVNAVNDLWRSAVLFRPAYVLRNIGEMQSRMFLAGHSSIFSHPMAVAAFALGTGAKHEWVRNLANRFNRADRTATGARFSDAIASDLDDMRALDDAVQVFAESTLARTSRLDMRTHRAMEAFHGLEEVGIDKAGFNVGWADQLLTFRASRVARIIAGADPEDVATAVARGADREDAIVNWMLSSPQARPVRQMFADNDPTFARIFGNPRTGTGGDPSALKQFLFTAEGSIQKRMDYYVRGNDELREFIRSGDLKRADGGVDFSMTIQAKDAAAYGEAMQNRARNLSRKLEPFRKKLQADNPDTALTMRMLRVGRNEEPFKLFDSVFDSFFNWAGRMENAWSVGPEFAFAYHSKLAELLPAIRQVSETTERIEDVVTGAIQTGSRVRHADGRVGKVESIDNNGVAAVRIDEEDLVANIPRAELSRLKTREQPSTRADREQVFDVIRAAEGRTRKLSETMQVARAGLKSDRPGSLTLEDASAMASAHASEHVKTFFYDALRRQQVFHAMRVVWPFAQSFVDTLWRWGTLAAKRPYVMEKVGRLGTAMTEPGSEVIYDTFDYIDPFSNRQWHDPNQGVLWDHPQTGEPTLTFPLIGSALGRILSPVAGGNMDLAGSAQLSAPLQNLNIALQGDVDYLPGVGPLLSFPAGVFFPDDQFGAAPEWLRSYLFPYGKPKLTTRGIVESGFAPTWARRMLGYFGNEDQRAYAVKGVMAHLLSTREYTGFRENPAVAQQLQDDVSAGASAMALIRAFGAFGLPAAPSQDIFAADTDGNMIASVYLADRWHNTLENNGRDTEAAIDELATTYGLETLAAVAGPSYEGEGIPFSGQAWEFFKDHPEQAEPYSDVIGYFFPGDYSLEANQWALEQDDRRRLSIPERTDNVHEFLYFAERRMIEGQAAEQQWNPDQLRQAQAELDQTYANVTPTFEVGQAEVEVEKIRRALDNFPALADTRGGQGASLALEAYDIHKGEAERMFGPGSTLSSQRAAYLRDSFLKELDSITGQYGGKNAEQGSVETIAQMLTRLVGEPEQEE